MAQPLFDQHPLEDYFRSAFLLPFLLCLVLTRYILDTGEPAEPMPGGSPDFEPEDDLVDSDVSNMDMEIPLPPFVMSIVQVSLHCTLHHALPL